VHSGSFFQYVTGPAFTVTGVAQDAFGQQYVTDTANNAVDILSSDGLNFIGSFSTSSAPYGIAVDSINQRIYVALGSVNQVAVYSLKAPYKLVGTIK
jgi:DNA-binding beta-propeller fold protein YncE